MLNKTQHKQLINLSTHCLDKQLIKPVEADGYSYFCVGTGYYVTKVKTDMLDTALIKDCIGDIDFPRCINAEVFQRLFDNCKKLTEFPSIDTKALSEYIKQSKKVCTSNVIDFVFGDVQGKLAQLIVNAEYLLKHLKMYGKIPYHLYGCDNSGSDFPVLLIEGEDMSSIILGLRPNGSKDKRIDTYSELDKILLNK